MSLDDLIGAQMVGPEDESGRKSGEGRPLDPGTPDAGDAGQRLAAGGADLGGLLNALLGGGVGAAGSGGLGGLLGGLLGGGAGGGASELGGLLGGLLGGGAGAEGGPGAAGLDVNGLAEQAGITPSIMQAVIPFVIGALLKGGQQRAAGIDLGAAGHEGARAHGVAATGGGAPLAELLGRLIGGQAIDSQFLHSTGLPQELARHTGLHLPKALAAIQHVLEALRGRVSPAHSPSTHAAAHPSATHATGTGKPKPKPKPARSASKPKPAASTLKPKPGAGTIKPKPGASAPKSKPGGGASGPKPPHGTSKPPRSGGSGGGGRSKVPGG